MFHGIHGPLIGYLSLENDDTTIRVRVDDENEIHVCCVVCMFAHDDK
jgi:hypothetical protein